ncbi:MAG: hypothetical protein K2Q12_04480 [Rickettsiales bacterium]|nr:hypothetical protein [Rickettsiales bacterium]
MPKRTDISSILIIGAGPRDSRYFLEEFVALMSQSGQRSVAGSRERVG